MLHSRQDKKKDDDRRPRGLLNFCDARAVCWSMVIPLSIVVVLLLRSRTSRWGLGTSSARALRYDRVDKVFNKTAEPLDTDPAFDPEADAARIKAETAAKAEARLAAAKAKVERTEGSKKRKAAIAAGEDPDARPSTAGTGPAGGVKPRKPGAAKGSKSASKPNGGGKAQQPRRKRFGAAAGRKSAGAKPGAATTAQKKPAPAHARPHKTKQTAAPQSEASASSQGDGPGNGSGGAGSNDSSGSEGDSSSSSGKRDDSSGGSSDASGGSGGDSSSGDGSGGSSSADSAGGNRQGDGGVGGATGSEGGEGSKGTSNSGGGEAAAEQPKNEIDDETRTALAMMSVKPEKKERPKRKRKTDTKFLVLPAHKCQLLDDPLANACMYGGLEEARAPDCIRATRGKTHNSYMPAFTRIAPYIEQYGPRKYSVGTLWDDSSEEAKGEWQSHVDNADVLIMDELALNHLGDKVAHKKVIALQHDAAASMRTCDSGVCASSILKEDWLLGYLQHTSLVPLTRNNAPRVHDTVHYDLLDHMHRRGKAADEHRMEPASKEAPFSAAMLAKLYTIVPLVWRWRFPITCKGRPEFTEWMMKVLQGGVGDFPPILRPLHERGVDLSFIGRLHPAEPLQTKGQEEPDELFRLHRQQLFDSVRKLKNDAPEIRVALSEPVEYEQFAEGLRNTKLFISPLGKAESSGKDYEAIISRALLIKPLASMLKSYPDIYEVDVTCVEVKPDYSDLETVVKDLLGDPDRMQRITDTAFQRLLSHASERPVAQDIAETLMDIVERDSPEAIVYLD